MNTRNELKEKDRIVEKSAKLNLAEINSCKELIRVKLGTPVFVDKPKQK